MLGLAGALLVFTGLWRAFEWMMGGRNKTTMTLIPIGLVYLCLGYLIVMFKGGPIVLFIAFILVAIEGVVAFIKRKKSQLRPWVKWAFILIDIVIFVAIAAALGERY